MQYLGLALLIMLIMELVSIMVVANLIGGLATFGLIILSFCLGLFILRRTAGFSKVLMAGELLRGTQSGVSMYQMMWPIRIPIAGFFFMLPGFISTLAAVLLLLPFKGKPMVATQNFNTFHTTPPPRDDDIIDADFTVNNGKPSHSTNTKRPLEVIEHQKDAE